MIFNLQIICKCFFIVFTLKKIIITMKIQNSEDLLWTDRSVNGHGFTSIRHILESDNMGFTVCETRIKPGKYYWHYKNHLETCYCVSGAAILTDCASQKTHRIFPGVSYSLDNNDPHYFEALEPVVLISVFNPPLKGNEIHKKDGSYEV